MIQTTTTGHFSMSTGHLRVSYINKNSLVLDAFKPISDNDLQQFVIPNTWQIMNNKQKSNGNCGYKMSQRRLKIRTKEEVISDISILAKKNRTYLNHKNLKRIGYGSLVYAATKHFGTWNNAILASGEQPLYQKWNKKKIVEEIKRLHKESEKVPNNGELRENGNRGLTLAAYSYFGSWANAINAAGLKPYRNDGWTKYSIIRELKRAIDKIGHVPSKRELNRLGRSDLVSSGSKMFEGYNNFLIAAELKPVLIPNIWTKERIREEIINISRKIKRTPTERDLVSLGLRTIIMASIRQFGGWNNAIKYANLIPNENCVKDKIWKEWELLVLEICQILYPSCKKYVRFPNKSIPDAYEPKSKLVIEVKINASDTTIHKDIANYNPYCNKIEIWHLTGKPVIVNSKKVRFVGPDSIERSIMNDKKLLERFYDLKNRVEANKCET